MAEIKHDKVGEHNGVRPKMTLLGQGINRTQPILNTRNIKGTNYYVAIDLVANPKTVEDAWAALMDELGVSVKAQSAPSSAKSAASPSGKTAPAEDTK